MKVTNSWYAPEAEKEAAEVLLDMGCDVITQHCDTSYPQTLAEERGVYGIGYNSDMSKEAPDACLCSVIWNWSAYYTAAVQSVIDGTMGWKQLLRRYEREPCGNYRACRFLCGWHG